MRAQNTKSSSQDLDTKQFLTSYKFNVTGTIPSVDCVTTVFLSFSCPWLHSFKLFIAARCSTLTTSYEVLPHILLIPTYRVSINSFPDYKHLLQENYCMWNTNFFFFPQNITQEVLFTTHQYTWTCVVFVARRTSDRYSIPLHVFSNVSSVIVASPFIDAILTLTGYATVT